MNWIERLFGKKEYTSTEEKFDELPLWLEAQSRKISQEVEKDAASVFSDIEAALRKIKKSTDLLEQAELEGRFHLKLVKIAATNRDNMIKQIRMLIENIAVPDAADIKTILAFHENAMQTLTVCLENIMKSYQYTKMVFPEESKDVIADVNALGRLLNQLIEPINEKKKTIDAFDNASNAIRTIRNLIKDIEKEKRKINESDEKFSILKKDMDEAQKDLAGLKESEQWEQYLNHRNELMELETKAEKIESEIKVQVLPLNKALGRLKQLSDSGRYTLAPEVKEGLHSCLLDPKCVNPGFLAEFKKIVESDALSLASDKRDKMLEQIKVVEASFDPYKKKYQALVKDIEAKKSEISRLNIAEEEKNFNERIAILRDKITFEEKELELSKKHLVSFEHNLDSKKLELQQIISTIDSRMKIAF
ncbi:MAG: hypothetical protein O8C66_14970 [Candidatus Methanoperedens sp.]|nr:hypothetical protein [Candidatus Methanoperedens sp.]MCZ7371804.1 hypothetical protein [Candidatus Methanoperedens sp.]